MSKHDPETLRRKLTYVMVCLFALNLVSALTVVFLVGFGLMNVPENQIYFLLSETVAQVAAMFFFVIKYHFRLPPIDHSGAPPLPISKSRRS
jgi:hypothetical protein